MRGGDWREVRRKWKAKIEKKRRKESRRKEGKVGRMRSREDKEGKREKIKGRKFWRKSKCEEKIE